LPISSGEELMRALVYCGCEENEDRKPAPSDDDGDSDDSTESEALPIRLVCLDLLLRVNAIAKVTGSSRRGLPDVVKINVVDLVSKNIDGATHQYILATKDEFGVVEMNYDQFKDLRLGQLRRILQRQYKERGRNISDIGTHSQVYVRMKFRPPKVMTKFTETLKMQKEMVNYWKETQKPTWLTNVFEELSGGKTCMKVNMSLGIRSGDDSVLLYPDSDGSVGMTDLLFSQSASGTTISSPPQKVKDRAVNGKAKRSASRSSGGEARQVFNHYYLHDDSPYYHGLTREVLSCFEVKLSSDDKLRKDLMAAIDADEFPSVESWLGEMMSRHGDIPLETNMHPPEGPSNEPPYRQEREKPSDSTKMILQNTANMMDLVKALATNRQPQPQQQLQPQPQQRPSNISIRFTREGYPPLCLSPSHIVECNTGYDLLRTAMGLGRLHRIFVFSFTPVEKDSSLNTITLEYSGLSYPKDFFKTLAVSDIVSIPLKTNMVEIQVSVVSVSQFNPALDEDDMSI